LPKITKSRQNSAAALAAEPPGDAHEPAWRRLSPEQRRAQIVDVTERLFSTRAYAEIGVADVARAVGVTAGLVYHYFETKEALFLAAFEVRARELLEFCDWDPSLPFEVQVERGVRGYLDFVEAHGRAYVNLFHGPALVEEGFVRVSELTREVMVDRFVIALGARDPSKYPALRLSLRGYLGYSESVVLLWCERRAVAREALEKMLFSAILAAVRVGLASETAPPMSGEDAVKLERRYRRRFKLR
jgi:AcrR family transcriptional regulator